MKIGMVNARLFKKGDLIFADGDLADCAYIIDHGEIEIFTDKNGISTPLSLLGVGDIFGEMAIIDGRRRSASARAFTDCKLTVVSQSQVQERVDHADPIVRLLLMVLLDRVRSSNGMFYNEESRVVVLNDQSDQVIEKIKFESELLEALENKDFVLHYQPIVNLCDNSLAGVEALIRWESKSRGLVRPELFMGIAEETSLIVPIGKWVYEQAFKDLSALRNTVGIDNSDFFTSINISGRQFHDAQFFSDISAAAKKNAVNLEHIKLEITESVLMDGAFAINSIRKLRDLGFKISMDDFGTGYSSLSYLNEMSFDNLKIDRSFVKNLQSDRKSLILCRSIANIARDLDLKVVAEGVETIEQAKILLEMGCKFGQGFYFGKPMPMAELISKMPKALPKVG